MCDCVDYDDGSMYLCPVCADMVREDMRIYFAALALVERQAEDEGLWFEAKTAPEAYLQQELRKLHQAIDQEPFADALDKLEA